MEHKEEVRKPEKELTETVRALAASSSDSLLAKSAVALCDALDAMQASLERMDASMKEALG